MPTLASTLDTAARAAAYAPAAATALRDPRAAAEGTYVGVRTSITPEVGFRPLSATTWTRQDQGGGIGAAVGNVVMSILRPAARISSPMAERDFAPWGDPDRVPLKPLVAGGVVLVFGLAAYGAYRLVRG